MKYGVDDAKQKIYKQRLQTDLQLVGFDLRHLHLWEVAAYVFFPELMGDVTDCTVCVQKILFGFPNLEGEM